MDHLLGGCLCGAVRYEIATGESTNVDASSLAGTYCHCSMCRKATGGGYAMLFHVPRDTITWTKGEPKVYRSSPVATRGFCNECGSPLYYDGDAEPTRSMTVGSLDNPSIFKPDHHYGIESRLPWADCGRDLPGKETEEQFEGQPGRG
jgi:hypothetical protein